MAAAPLASFVLLVGLAVGLASCASNPDKKPATRTADAALKDPYGDWSKVDTNISGSATRSSHPEKSSFWEDLDRFLLK